MAFENSAVPAHGHSMVAAMLPRRGDATWPLLILLLSACGDGDKPWITGAISDAAVPDAAAAGLPEAAVAALKPPGLARNVIVIMGDGMGPEQLSTARYAKTAGLRLDALQGPALVNTDSLTTLEHADDLELWPTDSAAAATVIATGARVENGRLSLTRAGDALHSVLEVCQRAGKATGLITTSFFFDASPAAFAVHQASRDESVAIVRQMLGQTRPDVVMGNGGEIFDNPLYLLGVTPEDFGYFVVRDRHALAAWDPRSQPRLLGLFSTPFVPNIVASENYSMTPALERTEDSPDPTLADMTARALARLAQDPDGFFLFAEDELLDEMGHRGPAEVAWANRAYPQQAAALDDALGVALDWVEAHSSFEQTLIVLLADHETGGYGYDHALGPSSGRFAAFDQGERFPVGRHTRTPTAVYAIGPGSESVHQLREHADTHRLLLGELPP
jgi:alkaline phosphatase